MKRFYGEMWGDALRRGGTCKNPMRLYVGLSYENCRTVEYMWVNIRCMLIALAKMGLPRWERATTTTMLSNIDKLEI